MSVIINVIGSKQDSDEYQCAQRLKILIESELPASAMGEITLHANVTLTGQSVKDVDIMMMGTLQNYNIPLNFSIGDKEYQHEKVAIDSFCTTIEVKSHSVQGIFREGTEFYVRYGKAIHSVTTQSNEQKISTFNFLKQVFGSSPFVTNVIWFTGINNEEHNELLTIGKKKLPSNTLSNIFTAKELFQTIALQKTLHYYNGTFHFDSNGSFTVSELNRAFKLFTKAKESMGTLKRKRIEQITNKNISDNLNKLSPDKMTIYRGRAGTGKTVGLIQLAIDLVDTQDSRVLILTYNRALVSDIRRLFTLAELPDMFETSCVTITTMQSFFFSMVNKILYEGELTGDKYLANYESLLNELTDLLDGQENGLACINELLSKDLRYNWDYCLIDEAQDWSAAERDLILHLFRPENIIVADGGRQFVRNMQNCDWNIVNDRKNIKLKYCLRQKVNLIRFINHCFDAFNRSENRITSSNQMPGGKILIGNSNNPLWSMYSSELHLLKEAGNIPYDMLILVPHSMVSFDGEHHFKYTTEYEKHGLYLWDGTNETVRKTFSLIGDEIRVLQYESARGLEGWTVVCLELDEFLKEKLSTYDEDQERNALFLESSEDCKVRYLLNWLQIPLTRAIDTLVITLKDPDSPISIILKSIANNNPDYISLLEEDA